MWHCALSCACIAPAVHHYELTVLMYLDTLAMFHKIMQVYVALYLFLVPYCMPICAQQPAHLCNFITLPQCTSQVERMHHDQLPHYGSGASMSRPDAERLLRRLVLLGMLYEETSRQQQYQAIISVVRVNQVGMLPDACVTQLPMRRKHCSESHRSGH